MIAAEQIVAKARARCAAHRGPTTRFCQRCFRVELEAHLAAENPSLDADAVTLLVDEWILAADQPPE